MSSTDHEGREFWLFAAEREDVGRFIVHAAFVELEAAIRAAERQQDCERVK